MAKRSTIISKVNRNMRCIWLRVGRGSLGGIGVVEIFNNICSKSRGQTIIVKLWIVHKARTDLSLLFHSSLFLQLIHTQSHYCGVFLVAFSSIMSENAHQLTDSQKEGVVYFD